MSPFASCGHAAAGAPAIDVEPPCRSALAAIRDALPATAPEPTAGLINTATMRAMAFGRWD
jgi:hypothetical protein